MGEIIGTKVIDDKVIYKVMVDEKEAMCLRGCIRNISIISCDLCDAESRIVERGKNGTTKHFIIPIKHRTKAKKKHARISYQKIELDTKIIFVYVVDDE